MFKISHIIVSSLVAPVALIALVGASGVAKADAIIANAEFCVDATHFRFMVDVSEPLIGDADHTTVTMVFRIGADAPVFASPDLERITVNFDLDTGAVTLGPLVEIFGAPLDRWLNENPITDFTVTSVGGAGSGTLRVEGSVPHGTQPFVAGDTINQVLQREVSSHIGQVDAVLSGVVIDSCNNQIDESATLGFGVTLGTGIVIEPGATIGDFTEIRDDVFIGERVVIGPNSVLDIKTEIDDDAKIGALCNINSILNTIFHPATVAKEAEIGAGCDLAGGTEVGRGVIIGSGFTTMSEFFNENVNPVTGEVVHTVLSAVTISRGVTIGNDVTLDHGTVVHKGVVLGDSVSTTTVINHIFHPVVFDNSATVGEGSSFGGGTNVKPQASVGMNVTVGNEVFIGTKAVINDGITIGNDAFIGPGAVVNSDVPPGATVH